MSEPTPSDTDLRSAAVALRGDHPTLGLAKLLGQLKIEHPTWSVSEKRLKKFLPPTASTGTASTSESKSKLDGASKTHSHSHATEQSVPSQAVNAAGEKSLIASTGIDHSVDVGALAPKVKVKMFGGGKGKGLVAKEKLLGGEMIWQEEPWVVTPDPNLYPYLTTRQMCSQCFNLFPQPSPPLSVPCKHCGDAHFCNRLCYSKAQVSGGHHDLLCVGQNKEIHSLTSFIKQKKTRSVDAVARIIAIWRGEREWGSPKKAEEIERRVWSGMARISQKEKEAERREWEYVGGPRLEEWQSTHVLLLKALNPSPKDDNYKSFQKLLTGKKKARPVPLTKEEEERWFSFESFLQLLGLVGLNQEDSGGLYALHAHMNHSCDPNVQVRNLPKTWNPPSPSDLPADLPPPMNSSNRGTNRLTMLARKTVHPGDELVISYVDQRLGRAERRTQLREGYGFWCTCTRCVREKKDEDRAEAKAKAKAEKEKVDARAGAKVVSEEARLEAEERKRRALEAILSGDGDDRKSKTSTSDAYETTPGGETQATNATEIAQSGAEGEKGNDKWGEDEEDEAEVDELLL